MSPLHESVVYAGRGMVPDVNNFSAKTKRGQARNSLSPLVVTFRAVSHRSPETFGTALERSGPSKG